MPASFFKSNNLVNKVNVYSKLVKNMSKKMSKSYTGTIEVNESELNLDSTLLGGQSFRWRKCEADAKDVEFRGVAQGIYWVLKQTPNALHFEAHPPPLDRPVEYGKSYFSNLLKNYFRLQMDLPAIMEQWRNAHSHFEKISLQCKAVRVLSQEPFENLICFICSQNNNIKRISAMVQCFCSNYGKKIGIFNGREEFTFPTLQAVSSQQEELEQMLRVAKFGYRAKFIADCIKDISSAGGDAYFQKLQQLSFYEARDELVKLPGIGYKVADCICLMSLNHLEAVPIDTHILQIACQYYLPELPKTKTITRKHYEEVANYFRKVYGPCAGWAQTVLFCSDLPQFQKKKELKAKIKKIG